MEEFEYRKLKDLSQEEFDKLEHDKQLGNLIKSKLNEVCSFLHNDVSVIKEYQLKQIQKLVDYAYTNIPLYKKKYDKVGYKVGSIKTFDDFYKLPILYKDELISGFPDEIVKNVNDFKFSTRSSGSSGKFLTLAVSVEAIYKDTLQGIRQFITQSNNEYKKEDVVLFIYTCPWWVDSINGEYKMDYLPTTMPPNEALEYIMKTKPFMISTYPTYLQRLCEFNVKLSDYGVKYVIVHSEQSNRQLRFDMAQKLGVEVLDEYSSEELTRIALECPNHNYHIEEDASFIEIIDEKTHQHIEDGEGVVVGTNLLNYATPIIRYYQGDIATIDTKKKCSCGNNGRIVTSIEGREMDCINSNNRIVPASSLMDLAYNWFLTYKIPVQGIKYQIIQTHKDKILVYLSKGLYNLSNKDMENIKESLYSVIDRNLSIEIKFTEEFYYKSNKFKPVVNLIGENYEQK